MDRNFKFDCYLTVVDCLITMLSLLPVSLSREKTYMPMSSKKILFVCLLALLIVVFKAKQKQIQFKERYPHCMHTTWIETQ